MIKIKAKEYDTTTTLIRKFRRATSYNLLKYREKKYFIKPSKRNVKKINVKKIFFY